MPKKVWKLSSEGHDASRAHFRAYTIAEYVVVEEITIDLKDALLNRNKWRKRPKYHQSLVSIFDQGGKLLQEHGSEIGEWAPARKIAALLCYNICEAFGEIAVEKWKDAEPASRSKGGTIPSKYYPAPLMLLIDNEGYPKYPF